MFGYIKAYKPEMKIKEYELYKGIYCSLCKQLGKSYGIFSRLVLNYDFTFLAVCLMAAEKNEQKFYKSHCSFCPAKKCICVKNESESLKYAAAITVITAYYKVKDNFKDGSFSEKIISAVLLPYFKIKFKKAAKDYPDISKFISAQMENQSAVENRKLSSVDIAADASAKAMGEIISNKAEKNEKEILYRFGYCVGRFVYIADALDDLEKDYKKHNFNPLIADNKDIDFKKIRKNSFSLLDTTADELAKAYELIDFSRYKPILDNIIYYGLDMTIDKVLRKDGLHNEESI